MMKILKWIIFFSSLVMTSACLTQKQVEKHEAYQNLKKKKSRAEKKHKVALVNKDKEIDDLRNELTYLEYLVDSLEVMANISPNASNSIRENVKKTKSYKIIPTNAVKDINGNEASDIYVDNQKTFSVYEVKNPSEVQLFWKNKGKRIGNIGRLRGIAKGLSEELIFGMNAGIFTQGGRPEGLFVVAGKEQVPLIIKKGEGNFYLKPNGVFFINEKDSAAVLTTKVFAAKQANLKVKYATQSGPMLVIDNEIHQGFNSNSKHFNIRNGVGVRADGSLVFLISNKPVTLYMFASVFRDHFQCPNALYLDGAISKAYLPKLNKNEGLTGSFGPLIGIYRNKVQKKTKPKKSK